MFSGCSCVVVCVCVSVRASRTFLTKCLEKCCEHIFTKLLALVHFGTRMIWGSKIKVTVALTCCKMHFWPC